MTPLFFHVPTPGDHYSALTGSATMTVIYEMSRQHELSGGRTQVVVGRGTRHDYPVGECLEADFLAPPRRRQKLADIGMGRLGLPRKFVADIYRPAAALAPDTDAVIFVHNAPGALPMLRAGHPSARLFLYAHNDLFQTYTTPEIRRTLAAANGVICVSQFLADALAARLGPGSARVHAVNNGVDPVRFCPAQCPHPGEPPVILFVGRVVPEEGPDLLLKAAQKIYRAARPFQVRIVGSQGFSAASPMSDYEKELRALAAPLGKAVQFRPFADRAAILNEYQNASIFCAPSNWDEPCTLTVPEAMACGLPTVAARRGGIPEVGGSAVLYFDTTRIDQLAERLAYLVEDAEARTEWGCRARARAEEISWQVQYGKLRESVAA